MFKKPLAAVALAAVAVAFSTSHDARADINEGAMVCTQSSEGFPVCVGSVGEGGASILAYAAALPGGGWTEVYDDGDWWVDHNPDGSVSIGFDEGFGSGASYIKGPSLPEVPGNYQKKSKPSTAGKPTWKGPKRVLSQLKASASTKTGAFTSLTPTAAQLRVAQGQTTAPTADITFAGYGQCKGFVVVTKDGKLVSSKLETLSFPSKKAVALPKTPGKYKIELAGNSGCMGQKRATEVSVVYDLVAIPTPVLRGTR